MFQSLLLSLLLLGGVCVLDHEGELGGYAFDVLGSYDPIWMASIVLGIGAALLHLPIAEQAVRSPT